LLSEVDKKVIIGKTFSAKAVATLDLRTRRAPSISKAELRIREFFHAGIWQYVFLLNTLFCSMREIIDFIGICQASYALTRK